MVTANELRYFVFGGVDALGDQTEAYRISDWVHRTCAPGPWAEHGGEPDLTVLRCEKS